MQKGFTLVETLVALGIFTIILVSLGAFGRDVFFFNDVLQTGLNNVTEARKVLKPLVNEIRSAQPSNLGAYPIAQSATSSFSFYVDVDGDGLNEKIRYFLDGTDFKKGIIKPNGNPLVYSPEDEQIIQVIRDVVPGDYIFSYYDSIYDGTASSTALIHPVTPSDIRLVRVDLTVDTNPDRAPSLLTITIQATLRNLKDNL